MVSEYKISSTRKWDVNLKMLCSQKWKVKYNSRMAHLYQIQELKNINTKLTYDMGYKHDIVQLLQQEII